MELTLNRIYKGTTYTIGHLYINGKYFCDTIEDTVRILNTEDDKIPKKTAIPDGRYRLILTYSPHFHRVLPELLNVPFFKNIRIHNGNTEEDSAGCIIVGLNKTKGKVINSNQTLNKLMDILNPVNNIGEKIYIKIS